MVVEPGGAMETLLVTCPESGRREEIGCIVGRDGEPLVVLRCTRFDPEQAVTCSTGCIHCPDRHHVEDPWRLPVPR